MVEAQKKKILLVEDEDDSRILMAKKLEQSGYKVFQACHGLEGIQAAEDHCPDLIITDVVMPKMNGNEFVSVLRQRPLLKDIPIIVMSIRGNMRDYFERLGVNEFLSKPFLPKELVSAVDQFFNRSAGIRDTGLEVKRVLIAGSDSECIGLLGEHVRSLGHHAECVLCPGEMISRAVSFSPEIILIDARLDGAASFEIVRVFRRMPQFKKMPVLIYSSCQQENDDDDIDAYQTRLHITACVNRCMDEGATEYIGKCRFEVFSERLKKYLTKGAVILIDDDEGTLLLLKNRIEKNGYMVLTARDGGAGLSLIKQIRPHVIVLDVIMPKVNGYEVLEAVKSDPLTRDIPIIMLTVRGEDAEIQKGLDLGADDYIVKPFHAELLLKRIESYLTAVK